MIVTAAILMTVAFPGAYFPAINSKTKKGRDSGSEDCEATREELSVLKPAGYSLV